MDTAGNIRRYATNLFAYPKGYFEQHTAAELKVSEEERQELIRMHGGSSENEDQKPDRLSEFEKEMAEEW